MSIEGILLEKFSALPHTGINSSTKACPRHAVFLFLSDDSKQDSATTTTHSKRLIELFKKNVLTSTLRTIWGENDGCADQYICASALYLISVMSKC